MEAMNQSGQPQNSGKRGPMWPAPLTNGGLTLEEDTCRGTYLGKQKQLLLFKKLVQLKTVSKHLWEEIVYRDLSWENPLQ